MAKVLRLPDRGRLIVCSDLHGCLADFGRIVELFEHASKTTPDTHLLLTGDFVHGPYLKPERWRASYGEYYCDASDELISALMDLKNQYPDRIHALLGNHEHGHIGGAHTTKFAKDEVATLERKMGRQRTNEMKSLFSSLPIAAVSPCGVVFTHAAPAAQIESIRDIECADLATADGDTPAEVLITPVLGPLLWSLEAPIPVARKFVDALDCNIAVFGHIIAKEGFKRIGDGQIIISTSCGVARENKVYLNLDLSARYTSVKHLRPGFEILPLYPDS